MLQSRHARSGRVFVGTKTGGSVYNQYGQRYDLSGGNSIDVAGTAEKADDLMLGRYESTAPLREPTQKDRSYPLWKEIQDYNDYVTKVGDTRFSEYFRKQFPELRRFFYLDDNDSALDLLKGQYESMRKQELNEPYEQILTTKTVVIPTTFATPEKYEIIKKTTGVTVPIVAHESDKEISGYDKMIPIASSLN